MIKLKDVSNLQTRLDEGVTLYIDETSLVGSGTEVDPLRVSPAIVSGNAGGGGVSGSRMVYPIAYTNTNTFTLPVVPTAVYAVLVYGNSTPMINPFASFTWTPGSVNINITDILIAGDTVYFDVQIP